MGLHHKLAPQLTRYKMKTHDFIDTETFKKAYAEFNKQNVDKNGKYIKHSDLETKFDGLTQMYEELDNLEKVAKDFLGVIEDARKRVKERLESGNYETPDDPYTDDMFQDVQDVDTYVKQWLSEHSNNMMGGLNCFFFPYERR